jgi:hypothetical protein
MPPPKSFGTPNVTGKTVEELAKSVQFWLQHFADRLDTLAGLRGQATFYGAVDHQGNTIDNVGDPTDDNGAVPARLTIIKREGSWDAQGLGIFNLPPGATPRAAANVGQLGESLQNAGATAPPPAVEMASTLGSAVAGYAFGDHTHAPLIPFGLAVVGQQTYVVTSVTPSRTFDAITVTLPELAQIVATIIEDLRTQLLVT